MTAVVQYFNNLLLIISYIQYLVLINNINDNLVLIGVEQKYWTVSSSQHFHLQCVLLNLPFYDDVCMNHWPIVIVYNWGKQHYSKIFWKKNRIWKVKVFQNTYQHTNKNPAGPFIIVKLMLCLCWQQYIVTNIDLQVSSQWCPL